MDEKHIEVLSAFFDGETVDADVLAASLEDPEAASYLREFARLRRAVQEDTSRPDEDFCEAVRERLAREEGRHLFRRRLFRASLAASLLLAAGAGGFSVRVALDRRGTTPGREAAQLTPARPSQAGAAPVKATSPEKPASVRVWITGWSEI